MDVRWVVDNFNSWAELVRVLAKLHSVDYKKIGLEKYGKDSGYYKRQAKSLVKVHDMQAKSIDHRTGVPVGPMPRFYEVSDYLANAYCPDEACIVHGDYKMDNVMFHKTEPRIIGILDWELSTIGNPRADLINMTQLFRHSTKPAEVDERPLNVILKEAEENYITKINDFRYEGIQSQQELVELYCKLTNRAYPLSGFEYASVFGLFRNSIIYHGIAARYANGQATSTYAKQVAVFAPGTILLAATIMDRAKKSEQNVVDSKLQSKL
ncbi:Acyl-CoA dehydrogenase family member 11 [Zancudomyces culisetae]|uniref:Acyl-CoA dehydrogenase family member 11 n=1 Tax=Zancudomyces culisetae TaxID=1213189 RepID=A0A1R1PES6_ZANCU|nr:Acyl-CoA dehydrogenase family member 11 [Zancudomyces culisetae]OMH82677.1 Acyl-CoA dehydrogenase family member 11 [Zancudomyces culisetae]OMH84536.1 Acyl-CoA dehydrogenase family member 11 [Zancudomyces culisetae]|eukprot:OMH79382.1 Acyl-CoA dehydrogenase family member 11 [Zancudomyces culisetae]